MIYTHQRGMDLKFEVGFESERESASMEMETESLLIKLCLQAATDNLHAVEKWRRQRRSLERLPSHLAESLILRLVRRRLMFPSLLEYPFLSSSFILLVYPSFIYSIRFMCNSINLLFNNSACF